MRMAEDCFNRALSGHGQALLISGEIGLGKSRLVHEFVQRTTVQATVLAGSGHRMEQRLPYWPIVQALRSRIQTIEWAMQDLDPSCTMEIGRLVPELQTLTSAESPPLPSESRLEHTRLFQALAHLFHKMAVHRPPLVLCIDDLQWADETTFAFLAYLARHLANTPFLLLATHLVDNAAEIAALRAELGRHCVLNEIQLKGLSLPDISRLVREGTGQSIDSVQMCQRLQQYTAGNPFFILEMLRTSHRDQGLTLAEVTTTSESDANLTMTTGFPIPDSVQAAILNRIKELQPETQQVLETCAVIGRQFDLELIMFTSHDEKVI